MTKTTIASYEKFATSATTALKGSVEKSMTAMTEMNDLSKKNLEAVMTSVTAAAKGAETLGASVFAYSKKAMEEQVAAAKILASAKSLQEVVELQTGFAKSAFETYIAEMNKMAETFSASVKDSMTPISERVTAVVERFQVSH